MVISNLSTTILVTSRAHSSSLRIQTRRTSTLKMLCSVDLSWGTLLWLHAWSWTWALNALVVFSRTPSAVWRRQPMPNGAAMWKPREPSTRRTSKASGYSTSVSWFYTWFWVGYPFTCQAIPASQTSFSSSKSLWTQTLAKIWLVREKLRGVSTQSTLLTNAWVCSLCFSQVFLSVFPTSFIYLFCSAQILRSGTLMLFHLTYFLDNLMRRLLLERLLTCSLGDQQFRGTTSRASNCSMLAAIFSKTSNLKSGGRNRSITNLGNWTSPSTIATFQIQMRKTTYSGLET